MPSLDDDLSLVEATVALRQDFGRSPAYNRLWHPAVRGDIPAERGGRRLRVRRPDLPRVAAVLGVSKTA